MQEAELDLRIAADVAAVPRLIDRLEAYAEEAELPPRLAYRLAMICEELATNVATHGSQGEGAATFFAVRLHRAGPELHLEVEDDGAPFDPLSLAAPDTDAPLDERDIGGLGIHLIRKMTRTLKYERVAARNRLNLVLDAEG